MATVSEVIVANSNGAYLIKRTTHRAFRKPVSTIRCQCPFLCDACSESCEFDEINEARQACRDAAYFDAFRDQTL